MGITLKNNKQVTKNMTIKGDDGVGIKTITSGTPVVTQEIIEKPMSAECTMKQYEAIPDADFVENREYQLTDYPDNGANAEQMTYALTCKRLFPAGTVVTFSGTTDSNYTNGHLYQIQVDTSGTKSWKDITPAGEQSIPILTGTQEKPINLATDLEVGKWYLLTGYLRYATDVNIHLHEKISASTKEVYVLASKDDFYRCLFRSYYLLNTNNQYTISDCDTRVSFNPTTGNIQVTVPQVSVRKINNDRPSGSVAFYAPTTSGTANQILQSNGEGKAPTWIDNTAPFVLDITDLTTKVSDANLTQLQNNKVAYIRYIQTDSEQNQTVYLYKKDETYIEGNIRADGDYMTFTLDLHSSDSISLVSNYLKVYITEPLDQDWENPIEKGQIVQVTQKALLTPSGTPTNGQMPIVQAGKLVWGNVSTSGQIKTVTYDNTTLGDHITDILPRVNVENGGTLLSIGFKTGSASVAASATKTTITNGVNPTIATSSEAVLKPATFYSFRSADINKTGNVTMLTLNGPNGLTGCSSTNIEITSDSSTETPTNTCVANGCGQSVNADGAVEIITFKGVNLLSIPLEHLVIDYFIV